MLSKKRKPFAVLLCISLMILMGLTGCSDSVNHEAAETTVLDTTDLDAVSVPALQITVTDDLSLGMTKFTSDELDGNFTNDLRYYNVTDVCIAINSSTMPLEDALKEGFITEEEIFCFARMDAANGFCNEEMQSVNGLTHFTYSYPEYNLRMIYDIYETPDGQQHLICDMAIYSKSMILGAYTDFLNEDTGEYLDQEDWGLTLEVTDVSPSGLTLVCTQTEGQQIGQLNIYQYSLHSGAEAVKRLDEQPTLSICDLSLKMGAQSEFSIDWTENYRALPSGEYEISLFLQDIYEESDVHPLMKNYYDKQIYQVSFVIP